MCGNRVSVTQEKGFEETGNTVDARRLSGSSLLPPPPHSGAQMQGPSDPLRDLLEGVRPASAGSRVGTGNERTKSDSGLRDLPPALPSGPTPSLQEGPTSLPGFAIGARL